MEYSVRIIETPSEMKAVEKLQEIIWGTNDIVPTSMLTAAVHNGGLLLGAYDDNTLVGFTFSFLGIHHPTGSQILKHCSHMLAVHPEYRSQGIGFILKRAQWQMVRQQGISLITWTYDPLLSRNAYLNIDRLGGVVNTYLENYYGEMDDKENAGVPSDRFLVELWVDSQRVREHMSRRPRRSLDLGHYFSAGAEILNPIKFRPDGFPLPPQNPWNISSLAKTLGAEAPPPPPNAPSLYLVEIPPDFQSLKSADLDLAIAWRLHLRTQFQELFGRGYLVTDFIYLRGTPPRSFYVLSNGSSTLGG